MYAKKMLALSASILFLSACGGGGGGDSGTTATPDTPSIPTPTTPVSVSTGVFIDSPVAGLSYQTETLSGITNVAGEYDYLPGETVTFSVGGIVFGTTLAGPVVTPLSLVDGATDASDPVVSNIVRLLLTLDDDGNPDNGIVITDATATAAAGLSVDFTAVDLTTDPGVSTLLPQLAGTPTLVDAVTAETHFVETLAAQSLWGSLAWGTGTWQSKTP